MTIDNAYRVTVSKGTLATIMGLLAYGTAKRRLRAGALGEDGLAIIELLDEETGIALDNPEVTALLDLLQAQEIISLEARERVAAFVAAQLGVPPEISPGVIAPASHRWRLPAGVDPSDWFTSDIWPEELIGDGYQRVWTAAITCTHPEAVREV